jgi:hypothetical protein
LTSLLAASEEESEDAEASNDEEAKRSASAMTFMKNHQLTKLQVSTKALPTV